VRKLTASGIIVRAELTWPVMGGACLPGFHWLHKVK
jgi:hypothetical protein